MKSRVVCWFPHGPPGGPQGNERKREAGAQLRVRAGLLGRNPAGFPTAPQGGRREASGNARLEHNCGSAQGFWAETLHRLMHVYRNPAMIYARYETGFPKTLNPKPESDSVRLAKTF